jgi:NOL1/NOP2/fmu family ribosome biogenesis protein
VNWWKEFGVELPGDCEVFGEKKARVATKKAIEKARETGWRVEALGIPAGKKGAEWKPSSYLLRAFPPSKRVVEVSRGEAEEFIRGAGLEKSVERGYVTVKCGPIVVGCGFSRGNTIENKVGKADRVRGKLYKT